MKFNELKKLLLENPKAKKALEKRRILFELSERIIDYRIKNGLSQAKLAQKIGKKQSSIARLESGTHSPTLDYLEKVARALHIEIRDLIPSINGQDTTQTETFTLKVGQEQLINNCLDNTRNNAGTKTHHPHDSKYLIHLNNTPND